MEKWGGLGAMQPPQHHATAPRASNNKRVRTRNSPTSVQQRKGQRWVLATGYNRIIFHILKEEPELPELSWPQSPARYEWTRRCRPSHRHGHTSRVCPTLTSVPHTHGRASHWQVCPTLTRHFCWFNLIQCPPETPALSSGLCGPWGSGTAAPGIWASVCKKTFCKKGGHEKTDLGFPEAQRVAWSVFHTCLFISINRLHVHYVSECYLRPHTSFLINVQPYTLVNPPLEQQTLSTSSLLCSQLYLPKNNIPNSSVPLNWLWLVCGERRWGAVPQGFTWDPWNLGGFASMWMRFPYDTLHTAHT